MQPTSTASIKAARWLLASLMVLSVIRAATQPVTPGEAWNFHHFIGPDWTETFSKFDVNNHILYTLLARISTSALRLTEFSLRLPALLAGGLYLWAVYRLARRWFGNGIVFLAVVGLLTLSPPMVDALSEARGYGLALACWTWALVMILESMEQFNARYLMCCAICIGLSVAASLAFLAPAIALVIVLLVWLRGSEEARTARLPLARIAFLTSFVLMVIPLNHVEWKTLNVGATSLRQSINEIMELSLGTSSTWITAAGRTGVALAAVAGAAAAVAWWRRREQALAVFAGGTLALTLGLLLAAHRWLHIAFPQAGFVYIIQLLVLSITSILVKYRTKTAPLALLICAGLALLCFASQFPFGPYSGGRQVTGGRAVAKALRASAGQAVVRVGVSAEAEAIMNYYKRRYGQGNWQPIERAPFDGSYQYYVLTPADRQVIEQRHLHILYRDAGLALAQ